MTIFPRNRAAMHRDSARRAGTKGSRARRGIPLRTVGHLWYGLDVEGLGRVVAERLGLHFSDAKEGEYGWVVLLDDRGGSSPTFSMVLMNSEAEIRAYLSGAGFSPPPWGLQIGIRFYVGEDEPRKVIHLDYPAAL